MVADACRLSATELYDLKKKEWVKNPWNKSSTVISTEMMAEELQSLALAYISGVEEKKYLGILLMSKKNSLCAKLLKYFSSLKFGSSIFLILISKRSRERLKRM